MDILIHRIETLISWLGLMMEKEQVGILEDIA